MAEQKPSPPLVACPHCGGVLPELAEIVEEEILHQIKGANRDIMRWRGAASRAERKLEAQAVAKRDGAVWKQILDTYCETFPGKRLSAKGVKSARATAVFQRIEQGATVEDWLDVIRGGQAYPYVVYGERRSSGSDADRADDLQDFAHLNKDRLFEFLRDVGRKLREAEYG